MIGLTDNKFLLLLLINILLLITGMFIDSGPAIMLLAPILCPVATSIGVNLVQFGLIMVINLTIGLLSPSGRDGYVCGIQCFRGFPSPKSAGR